jgi:hypothetical protein
MVIACGWFASYAAWHAPVVVQDLPDFQKALVALSPKTSAPAPREDAAPMLESLPDADLSFAQLDPVDAAISSPVTFVPATEVVSFSSSTSGVLLLPQATGATPDVANLFSDPVAVVTRSDGRGQIAYRDEVTGATTSLPFLVIPAPGVVREEGERNHGQEIPL